MCLADWLTGGIVSKLHYVQHCIESLLHSDWSSLRQGCKKRCANLHPFETCLKQGLIFEPPFTPLWDIQFTQKLCQKHLTSHLGYCPPQSNRLDQLLYILIFLYSTKMKAYDIIFKKIIIKKSQFEQNGFSQKILTQNQAPLFWPLENHLKKKNYNCSVSHWYT